MLGGQDKRFRVICTQQALVLGNPKNFGGYKFIALIIMNSRTAEMTHADHRSFVPPQK